MLNAKEESISFNKPLEENIYIMVNSIYIENETKFIKTFLIGVITDGSGVFAKFDKF